MPMIRVSPSGPELVYPSAEAGKVLGIDAFGKVTPTPATPPYNPNAFNITQVVVANTGESILAAVDVPQASILQLDVRWGCSDAGTGRVVGDTSIIVERIGSSPAAVLTGGNVSAVNFVNTTSLSPTPWAPNVALSGNTLDVTITADAINSMVAHVVGTATVTDLSGLPSPGDPIVYYRNLLLATAPALAFDSYVGRVPGAPVISTPLTAWNDQSGNTNNALSVGPQSIVYEEATGKPVLRTPATGGQLAVSGALPVSTSWTFALALNLRKNPASSTEIYISDGNGGVGRYIANLSGSLYYNDISLNHPIGTVTNGMHYLLITVDGASHEVTAYVDGVIGVPVAFATLNAWTGFAISGALNTAGPAFPLISSDVAAVYAWHDVSNTSARLAAFIAFCTAAFGAIP